MGRSLSLRGRHVKSRLARLAVALMLAVGMFSVSGCSILTSSEDSDTSDSSSSDSTFAQVAEDFDASELDLEYTDRDQDPSYDETEATLIELNGSEVSIEGDGASVEDCVITISAEGTYIVSGTLDDGQLVVEVSDEEKAQVVLNGVSIYNQSGPAIYIKEADKCFITLADGTQNVLSDGSDYELEDDSDEPYATLFSRADLTINGSGSLEVDASYRHAICSKDDLVITGGTFVINAVEDGLRGRDCVKILDGDFTIVAGGDGIKSNKDDDAERGFVSIDGGTFDIQAGDDGIQAVTYLRIAGGALNVEATDDAFHSDLEMIIEGGDMTVVAGDDAFHAETVFTINDGEVDVASCYEGYEAEKIYINGGTTSIVASDDAINASTADLEDSSDSTSSDTDSSDSDGDTSESDTDIAQEDEAADVPDAPDMEDASDEASAMQGVSMSTVATSEGDDGLLNDINEGQMNGGAPDNAFAETGDGQTMGDENCLIQINGGYTVLDADGDGVDSNGSIEITGGVLLVNGPASGADGAFDYDISATISGGTVLMVGSSQMAQNFTEGTQPFVYTSVSGNAGDSVALVDADGNTIVSLTATKQFGMVLASGASLEEDGEYTLVIGGSVEGANEDGYVEGGSVSGGSSTEVTASTTASEGLGGLGSDGNPMDAGQSGDVQVERREHF